MRLALALLALAVTAAVLRKRRPVTVPQCDADDSEIVGMPTSTRWEFGPAETTWREGAAWYVELAPTSRN